MHAIRSCALFMALAASTTSAAPNRPPEEVNDHAITVLFPFGPGIDSWGLERLRDAGLRDDCRIQVTGDSWTYANSQARSFQSISRLWPGSEGWAKFCSVAGNPLSTDITFSPDETTNAPVRVGASNEYRIFEELYPSGNAKYFTLTSPFAEEFFGTPGFNLSSGGRIWRSQILNVNGRRNGRISNSGEHWFARQLFIAPPNPANDQFNTGVFYADNTAGTDAINLDLVTGVRPYRMDGDDPDAPTATGVNAIPEQINASFPDLPLSDPGASTPGFRMFAPGFPDSGQYLSRHSTVFYRTDEQGQPEPGIYLSPAVGDSSWSYQALYIDSAGVGGNKTYSTEQLTRFLDTTTVRPDQPTLVIVYFATESLSTDQMVSTVSRGIQRWETAFQQAGLDRPYFLLMGNPAHMVTGRTYQQSLEYVEQQNAACLQLAQLHDRCAFISLFNLSDR